jgi:hypothetical protein
MSVRHADNSASNRPKSQAPNVGKRRAATGGMSQPRCILPGRFWLITRACTQQLFLLRPDAETNNAFAYCLFEAALRFGILVILPLAMSNHHHTVVFDPHGRICEFVEHFHKMLARVMNRMRDHRENFWSSDALSLVELVDNGAVIDKLIYTATNPVKADLVERAAEWPGFSGLSALLNGETVTAVRPTYFFRANGAMPRSVSYNLTIPSQLGATVDVLTELRNGIAEIEAQQIRARKKSGVTVLGRARVLKQSPSDLPATRHGRSELNPRYAARHSANGVDALQKYVGFLDDYGAARRAWLRHEPIAFPIGTYWLRRHMAVPIVGMPIASAGSIPNSGGGDAVRPN